MTELRRLLGPLIVVAFLLGAFAPLAVTGQGGSGVVGDNVLLVSDPVGDAGPIGLAPGGPVPPVPVFDHVDIVEVHFGPETADSIGFGITFNGWDETVSGAMMLTALQGLRCNMYFYFEDETESTFRLYVRSPGLNNEEPRFEWELNYMYWSETGMGSNWQWSGYNEADWDADTTTMRMTIPKNHLPIFPGPRVGASGDTLMLQSLSCTADVLGYGQYSDRLNDTPVSYPLRAPSAGDVVQVAVGGGEDAVGISPESWTFPDASGPEAMPVAPGKQTVIPIDLTNLASDRKLALLSAAAVDGPGEGWNLSIAPSVLLNGDESRTVNLIVTPPTDATSGTVLDARVTATVAAEDSVGAASIRLEVAPILSATQNTLHLHAKHVASGMPEPAAELQPRYDLQVSLNEDEPGWDAEVIDPGPLYSTRMIARLAPIAQKVELSAEDPASATLQVAGDGEIRVDVFIETEESLLYMTRGTYAPGTHELALQPYFEEDLELPFGTRIAVTLYVTYMLGTTTGGVALDGTSVSLPVNDVASGLTITDGTYLPNLGVARGEDRVAYLNPDRTYTYDLRLGNDGLETDDLTVTATAVNASGWQLDVVPGKTFRVPAGNATPLGIAVKAAADAQEGDVIEVDVKAVSKHDPLATASLKLRAIVTTELDLPDRFYEDHEDQMAPLTDNEESPPVHGLWVGAVLAGVLLWGRRRMR